ncbi:hypothetical protein [Hymenobacter arcticus]
MNYRKIVVLWIVLLAIHILLHGPAQLVAWALLGIGGAFWWKDARFFWVVLISNIVIGLGYSLLIVNCPQLLWLTRNSELSASAWLALVIGFNVISCCICAGIPYAIASGLRKMRSEEKPIEKPAHALSH